MDAVEFRFGVLSSSTALVLQVLTFQVVVVELCVEVLMIVDPRAYHMWVLLVEVCWTRCSVQRNLFVIAVVIGVEGFVSPEHHLTP